MRRAVDDLVGEHARRDRLLARQLDLRGDVVGEGARWIGVGGDLVGGMQPGADDAGQHLLVQLFLGVEVIMEIGLRNGRAARDLRGRGAVEAGFGKHRFRRFQDPSFDTGTAALPHAAVAGIGAGLIVDRQKA